MRLAPKPVEIGDRDGFKDTDIFGYEEFGRKLAALVESLEGPSVISLDGDWGSGKTVFVKQWAGLLRNRGSAVIYFDAFSADSGDDPLFDVASHLFAAAPDGEQRKDFAESAVALARELASVAAGVGLRVMTGGVIGESELGRLVASLANAKKTAADSGKEESEAFRSRVEGARSRATALSGFQEKLTALVDELREDALNQATDATGTSSDRPAVIVVDELDRCKPTYALNLLENVKHVFDVENICFLLVTHFDQLGHVVSREYGITDFKKYLEKFFHARFHLPDVMGSNQQDKRTVYCNYLWKQVFANKQEMPSSAASVIREVARHHRWSLRRLQQVTRNVWICLAATGMQRPVNDVVLAVVCSVNLLDPELYSRMRNGRASCEAVLKCIGVSPRLAGSSENGRLEKICKESFPSAEILEGGDSEKQYILEEQPAMHDAHGRIRASYLCDVLDSLGQQVQ